MAITVSSALRRRLRRATLSFGDRPRRISSSWVGGVISRSSHCEPGTKPLRRSISLKPERRDSGCSRRGVMNVPDPWLRRISPCSNSTSSALRAVTREMPSCSLRLRSDGMACSAFHWPAWIAASRLRASCRYSGVGWVSSGRRAWRSFMSGCPMRILECCRSVVQRKLIPLKYHVNASTLLKAWESRALLCGVNGLGLKWY